jgi:RNA polymerase sigma-70 factor, ECF subfamily
MLWRMQSHILEKGMTEGELAAAIMAAGARGAPAAEAELCARLRPRVKLYGMKHLRDAHAAQDLAQQVLLLVLEKLRAGALRDHDSVVSFVFGACQRIVLDTRRGQARREKLLERYKEDVPAADAGIAPRFDLDRLVQCLDGLAERERTVLVMTFFEERQAPEVAALLGVTAGNVRVIRHRGLARLHDCVTGN